MDPPRDSLVKGWESSSSRQGYKSRILLSLRVFMTKRHNCQLSEHLIFKGALEEIIIKRSYFRFWARFPPVSRVRVPRQIELGILELSIRSGQSNLAMSMCFVGSSDLTVAHIAGASSVSMEQSSKAIMNEIQQRLFLMVDNFLGTFLWKRNLDILV